MERLNNKHKEHRSSIGYDEPREFSVSFIPHKSGTYPINIDGLIEEVSQFATAIQVLESAKEDDDIVIYLQSPGGNVDATGALIHAMRKCVAPIHCVASGGCHSAATHILLACDSFELAENFNSLIHNGSSGSVGNINEYHAKSDFDKKFIYDLYKGIYEGFLTDDEYEDMMKGVNIWLDGSQWMERSRNRLEYFQAKMEAANKPQKKARKKKSVDTQDK